MTIISQLNLLESAGLIRQDVAASELEYFFRHSLVQDAAYASLLRQDRRQLHCSVGSTLEQIYHDRLEELAPLLAEHFRDGGDDERALKYYVQAADRAASQYANDEAAAHYRAAMEIAAEGKASDEMLIELSAKYGRVLELSGRYDDALSSYEELGRRGQRLGNRSMQLAGLTHRATIYSIPSARFDAALGETLSQQALALARELGDHASEARILWNLMHVYTVLGQHKQALAHGEQSLAIARQLDLREQMAYTLNDLHISYAADTQHEKATQALEEARTLWRELGNLPMLADNVSSSAELSYLLGQLDQALNLAQEALRISQSIANPWGQSYSLMVISFVYAERAQFGDAIKTMQKCIRLGEQAGFIVAALSVRAVLASMYISLGALDRATEIVQQMFALSASKFPGARSWGFALQAILFCAQGRLDDAETAMAEANVGYDPNKPMTPADVFFVPIAEINIALAIRDYQRALEGVSHAMTSIHGTQVYAFQADILHQKGRILLRQGFASQARDALMEARTIAETRGSIRALWQILADLATVESELGHVVEAEELRNKARVLVNEIAGCIDQPDIRHSFLATADVQNLLGAGFNEIR